jgi:hypothetical protein
MPFRLYREEEQQRDLRLSWDEGRGQQPAARCSVKSCIVQEARLLGVRFVPVLDCSNIATFHLQAWGMKKLTQ